MKRKILVCVLVCVMALSFAVPALAVPAYEAGSLAYEEIVPISEETRIYWRIFNGQLQYRVWGITSGRWLTDWTNI